MSVSPYDPKQIGQNIRTLRRNKSCTQRELARLVHCSVGTVSALECGRRDMSVNTLFALCRALQCRPGDLLAGQ